MFLLVFLLCYLAKPSAPAITIPKPDENLNIYMLPLGEGDSTVIQCPTGKLAILNMGSMYTKSYWDENDIESFIGEISLVETIMISRPHPSLFNLLPMLFEDLSSLKNVYLTCSKHNYVENAHMRRWINKLDAAGKITEIRSKKTGNFACTGEQCPSLKLCSDSSYLESRILAANLGGCSGMDADSKSNSLVLQIKFYDFSMILPGDLQDPSAEDNKYSEQVVASVSDPEDLQATVYQAAYHGDYERTNKYFFLNNIKPQYVLISNAVPRVNSTNDYTPRCELLYYLAHREGGSLLNLASTQSFQCIWKDGSKSRVDETNRALFLTSFDADDFKIRRLLHVSTDGEKHKVTHIPVPMG